MHKRDNVILTGNDINQAIGRELSALCPRMKVLDVSLMFVLTDVMCLLLGSVAQPGTIREPSMFNVPPRKTPTPKKRMTNGRFDRDRSPAFGE